MKRIRVINNGIVFVTLLCIVNFFSFAQEESTTSSTSSTSSVSDIFSLLSDEGKILYGAEPNSIMVIDHPQNVKKIEKYLDMIDVPAEQVSIDARVVEVTLTDDTALGINWQMFKEFEVGEMHVNALQQQIPYKGTESAGTFTVTVFNKNVQFVLNTLAQYVKTDLLSAPKITTLNGKEATIDVVQEVPWVEITVEMATEAGENDIITYTVHKEKVGITLKVTPTISPDGSISMELEPEVSEVVDWYSVPAITSQGQLEYQVPVIDSRKAKTNVIIKNGQTLIIGGMIKDKLTNYEDKIPLVGDIPILGHFFKSTRALKEKTELLIFVSPTIITPTELKKMAREERYGLGKRHTMEREAKEKRLLKEEKTEEGKKLWKKVEGLYHKGKKAYEQSHYGEAMYYFQKVLEIYPQHKQAKEYINKIQEKLKTLEQKEKTESMYHEGEKLYREGKYEEARGRFQEVLNIQPEYKEAKIYISRIEERLRENEKFNKLYAEAKKLAKKKLYKEAGEKFREALKIKPESKEVQKYFARILAEIKMVKEEEELNKKIQKLYQEGLGFYRERKYEKALTYFEKITLIKPHYVKALKLIKNCHNKIEQQKKVAQQKEIKELIKEGKDYMRSQKYNLALKSFSKILKIAPGNKEAQRHIAEIKERIEIIKEREGQQLMRALAQKQEEKIKKKMKEAEIFYRSGELEIARKILLEVLDSEKNKQAQDLLYKINKQLVQKELSQKKSLEEPEKKYEAALDAFKKGDYQNALVQFQKLRKTAPNYKKDDVIHYIEISQRKIREAEKEKLLEQDYNQAVSFFNHAFYDRAIDIFEEIKKYNSGYRNVSKYLQQAYERRELLTQLGDYEQDKMDTNITLNKYR